MATSSENSAVPPDFSEPCSVLPRIFGRPGGILIARSLEALIGKVIKISELKCVCLTYLQKGLPSLHIIPLLLPLTSLLV